MSWGWGLVVVVVVGCKDEALSGCEKCVGKTVTVCSSGSPRLAPFPALAIISHVLSAIRRTYRIEVISITVPSVR